MHARPALACGAIGAVVAVSRGEAPGRDLDALAGALGRAAGVGDGAVAPSDVRWEPSGGVVPDAVVGRWVLFLARPNGDDTRDVWRARARVTPEGGRSRSLDAHDLTSTPLGDDHALVVTGGRAAFATRAYGQEQSVTALDLDGEGAQNRAEKLADRAMAALTNLQQTGTRDGVGRVDVTLESPAAAVGLVARRRQRSRSRSTTATIDAAAPTRRRPSTSRRASSSRPSPGLRADASMHLPKRFSHWAVDTLRAVPWIGPAPIAWLEDEAFGARDSYRRLTFHATGGATDVVATAPIRRRPSSTRRRRRSRRRTGLRRASRPSGRRPEEGEGDWTVPDVPLRAKVPGVSRRRAVRLLPHVRPPRRGAPLREGPPRRDGHAPARPRHGGGRRGPQAAHRPPRHRAHPARPASTSASPPPSTARSRPSTATTG